MKFTNLILAALATVALPASAAAPASFSKCLPCHQATGQGIPNVFPPLAGSEWVNGPAENLIRIQLRGLTGKITVAGKNFNSTMPNNASLTDEQIAEALTYVRSSWGNKAPAVTPEMVKALRSEVGKPLLTVADLKAPNAAPKAAPVSSTTYKTVCTACHQATGQGIPNAFPPLAGSEWVNGPAENLIRMQLRGLTGEITVAGKKFNSTMPNNARLTDEQIAEALTYVRSSWGNKASAVTPEMVKALRSEVGKPLLTVADLKAPKSASSAAKPKPAAAATPADTKEQKPEASKETPAAQTNNNIAKFGYIFLLICFIPIAFAIISKK